MITWTESPTTPEFDAWAWMLCEILRLFCFVKENF